MRFAIQFILLMTFGLGGHAYAQTDRQIYVLKPDRVFDGQNMRANVQVRIEDGRITEIGRAVDDKDADIIDLSGLTLTPGLIDAHSHVLLHPYDETSWNDQVLKESEAERVARATNHLKATLMAGFTTLRDLGSEGAGYADVGLKQALAKGVIDGPRLLVAGPALVVTGSYGPGGFHAGVRVPLGAHEADGHDDLIKEVRRQIGGGADWIKVYADYYWGPNRTARPTYSVKELTLIVETARATGHPVVAHASTDEGMRRAIAAGVETIEHGDNGSLDTYRLMARKGIAICPTLAAGEAISRYRGWDGKVDTRPDGIKTQHQQIQFALKAKTPLCLGSDVGVFSHGDNAWEMVLLTEYGVSSLEVLRSATHGNAKILHLETEIGRIAPSFIADLAAFSGNPLEDIATLKNARFVMQNGKIIKHP